MTNTKVQTKKSADKANSKPISTSTQDRAIGAFDLPLPTLALFEATSSLPGAQAIRRQNILQLQRYIGNATIQRMLIQREDEETSVSESGDAGSKAEKVKREEFQKGVSTPIPAKAIIGDGKATLSVGNADVTILPDGVTDDEAYEGKAETSGGLTDWNTPGYDLGDDGKVKSFDEVKTPKVTIQTVYGPGTEASDLSGYGRGTTKKDVKAGNTSLGFHEGMHGKTTLDWLEANPLPKFEGTKGMTRDEFEAEITKYKDGMLEADKKLQEHQITTVDCVGTKASFCEKEEEPIGKGGGIDLGL